MLKLTRNNSIGNNYYLTPENGKTKITFLDKSITVNMNIEEVDQCWYNWQMKGQLIQYAFPMLNKDERDFLLTGMTPEEWNEIFDEN